MSDEENGPAAQADATVEQGAIPVLTTSPLKSADEPLGFLDAATKRAFGETEITSAITIRFLVEKVHEQSRDIERLRAFESKYYESDKELQIEKNKTKFGKAQEIVSSALLTIGGAGMGFAIKFLETAPLPSVVGFVLFAGIVAAGIFFKVGSR